MDNAVTGVDIDTLGNVYIVGQFNDSATFSTIPMESVHVLDPYIAKLSSGGQLEWVRTIGGPHESDQSIDVTVDPNGNAYMAAYLWDESLDFSGTVVSQAVQSSVALAKYDTDGNLQWARLAAGITLGVFGGLDYSPTGHLYYGVGHTFAKYDLDGDTVWTRQVPAGVSSYVIHDIEVDESGQYIYLTGKFAGQIDLDGAMLESSGVTDYDIHRQV
jgi:hypothetical protein